MSLHLTQSSCGVVGPEAKAKAEGRVNGSRECGVEGVEVGHRLGGGVVEGQDASRVVHVHRHFVGYQGGVEIRNCSFFLVVPEGEVVLSADETPALIVPAQPAVGRVSPPADPFVAHGYDNATLYLHLPVAATRQTRLTQNLPAAVFETLRVLRVRLLLSHHRHRLVVFRQLEVSVGGVWIQFKITEI